MRVLVLRFDPLVDKRLGRISQTSANIFDFEEPSVLEVRVPWLCIHETVKSTRQHIATRETSRIGRAIRVLVQWFDPLVDKRLGRFSQQVPIFSTSRSLESLNREFPGCAFMRRSRQHIAT